MRFLRNTLVGGLVAAMSMGNVATVEAHDYSERWSAYQRTESDRAYGQEEPNYATARYVEVDVDYGPVLPWSPFSGLPITSSIWF